ncbi:calcium-related spray protein [Diplocarpon rosae]|nr:calcium-related spray protein [Diplocarpon rosae]
MALFNISLRLNQLPRFVDDSKITASLFNVVFTPGNQTLSVKVQAESTVSGNVTFKVQAAAYGYTFLRETLDPCTYQGLTTLCPLDQLEIGFDETFSNISTSLIGDIPSVAYTIPDLDAVVTVNMYQTDNLKVSVGCVQVRLSNRKTVNQLGKFATWYLRSTGGKATSILTTLGTKSVQVAKRSLGDNNALVGAAHAIYRRTQTVATAPGGAYIVTGIQRIAFLAPMEPTNLFFTCITFYFIFVLFTLLVIWLFRMFCDLAIRAKWLESQNNKFQDFHDNWRIMMKGTIFRLILIGYAPMMIFSLWEFMQADSPAEVVLAILLFFGMSGALGLAAFHVITLARRSTQQHKTPAYLLYTNAITLKKWGFLFIQFRASAYWYILPTLSYIVLKAFFIGLAQGSGTTQAIALVLIEAAALIGVSVIRPFMDKTSNSMGIAICVVQFLNAILLLIFTDIFDGPGLLIGVCGVVFFFLNIIFVLVLLLIVLVASTLSIVRSDPETRYQPMADNRGSFIKSQTALTTELDMLAATARGDPDMYNKEARDLSVSPIDTERSSHIREPSMSSVRDERTDGKGWGTPTAPSRTTTPRISTGSDARTSRR